MNNSNEDNEDYIIIDTGQSESIFSVHYDDIMKLFEKD